jgi:hypothetical protein
MTTERFVGVAMMAARFSRLLERLRVEELESVDG